MGRGYLASVMGSGGLVAGVLGLLSVGFGLSENLPYVEKSASLYVSYVREPVTGALGLSSSIFKFALDGLIIWLALFSAINAFVYRADGVFLWEHIGRNYCYVAGQSRWAQTVCRLPKYLWAALMTPIVCLFSIIATARTGNRFLRMAYLIVEPKAVAKYVYALLSISALIFTLISLVAFWRGS